MTGQIVAQFPAEEGAPHGKFRADGSGSSHCRAALYATPWHSLKVARRSRGANLAEGLACEGPRIEEILRFLAKDSKCNTNVDFCGLCASLTVEQVFYRMKANPGPEPVTHACDLSLRSFTLLTIPSCPLMDPSPEQRHVQHTIR